MAFTIQAPKNHLLLPLFIILVILLAPIALLLSLVRMPFAKNRITALNEAIAKDWLPRKKYVYLNYDEGFSLANFVDRQLIPSYGSHIIFDRWSDVDSEWTDSEPDIYHRVTTIQQDVAGDFDGDAHLLVAVLTPQEATLTKGMDNVLYFTKSRDGYVRLNGKDVPINIAQAQITQKIKNCSRAVGSQR